MSEKKQSFVAIDTETTGLKPYINDDKAFLFLSFDGKKYIASKKVKDIEKYLKDKNIIKIFHNAVFDLTMLRKAGIEVNGQIYDTMVAALLINENKYFQKTSALKYLAREILHEKTNEEKVLNEWFKKQKIKLEDRKYNMLPSDIIIPYGEKDVEYTYNLYKWAIPILKKNNLWDLFLNECDLAKCLMDIQWRGILVDIEKAVKLSKKLQKEIDKIQKEVAQKYSTELNINSPLQIGKIFHKELKGNVLYDEEKDFSIFKETNIDIFNLEIELLQIPKQYKQFFELEMNLFSKEKICSIFNRLLLSSIYEINYIEQLDIDIETDMQYILNFKNNKIKKTQKNIIKVNKNILQYLFPKTLKKSKKAILTTNEAIQIYAEKSPLAKILVKYKEYKTLKNTFCKAIIENADRNNIIHCNLNQVGTCTGRFSSTNPNLQNLPKNDEEEKESTKIIRSLFIARPGFTNYFFDYDQIEYRLAADYAEDEKLIELINKGGDVHGIQAERIFRKKDYTKQERNIAKTINFAVLYGAGIAKIAKSLNCSEEKAKEIRDRFYFSNKKIKSLKYNIEKTVRERGYIFNKFGRRRHLSAQDSYKALNALCQGLAADIMKHAMVRVWKLLKNYKSNIILNIHDEIIVEIKNGEEHLVPKIKKLMEDWEDMFKVKISVGVEMSKTSWDKKKEVKI